MFFSKLNEGFPLYKVLYSVMVLFEEISFNASIENRSFGLWKRTNQCFRMCMQHYLYIESFLPESVASPLSLYAIWLMPNQFCLSLLFLVQVQPSSNKRSTATMKHADDKTVFRSV